MHEIGVRIITDSHFRTFNYFAGFEDRHAEADAKRPSPAGKQYTGSLVLPLTGLRAPAIDAVLEVADDRERRRRKAHGQPVQGRAGLAGELAEVAEIKPAAATAPLLLEEARQPVKQGAARAGQKDEPENDAEDIAMRSDQRLFDGQTGDFAGAGFVVGAAAPLADQLPRTGKLTHSQGQLDVGEIVADVTETHRQVEHDHIEGQRQDEVDVPEQELSNQGQIKIAALQ